MKNFVFEFTMSVFQVGFVMAMTGAYMIGMFWLGIFYERDRRRK